jgi:hypothetical protein
MVTVAKPTSAVSKVSESLQQLTYSALHDTGFINLAICLRLLCSFCAKTADGKVNKNVWQLLVGTTVVELVSL